MTRASRITISLLAVVAVGGAFLWWRRLPPSPAVAVPIPPAVSATTPHPAPAAHAPAPAIRYPVPPAQQARGTIPSPDEADAYLRNALIDLLGHKAALSFLHLDSIARRFVATVNNLDTDGAAAQLWPVNPTAGHFEAETRGSAVVISAKNAGRYTEFVRFVDNIDDERAVALYFRLYPMLQRAYEELGYPGKYFNDRVVEVIDNLLATPNVAEAIKVMQIAANDAAPRPGGLYLFADPTLENSTAGQKILLRMGPENAAKVMAKLTDIRRRIVNGVPALVHR